MEKLNMVEKEITKEFSKFKKARNFSEEDFSLLDEKLDNIRKIGIANDIELSKGFKEKFLSNINNLKCSSQLNDKKLAKKPTRKTAIVVASGIVGLALVGSIAYGIHNYLDDKAADKLAEANKVKTESLNETKELVMSENAKAFEDQTVSAVHELLGNGINYKETKLSEDGLSLENIELVESDKEVYAEMVAKYRLVANQANITNSEWAGYLGETSYSTLELVQNFYDVNNMLKNHLFGLTEDRLFDFNSLFDDENDAKLLNDFEGLIVEFNETKSEESAIKIKTFIIDNLTSTTGEFSYSNEAKAVLNSLLSAYVQMTNSTKLSKDAKLTSEEISMFFTLEDGCEQYEQYVSAISTEESIQAMNVYSEIETKNSMMESYIAIIEHNELNSIVHIIENVTGRIDLTVYEYKTVDAVEAQLEDKGIAKDGEYIGAKRAEDASDVKAPNGTDISQAQLDKFNVDTAAELEAAVEANPVLSEKTTLVAGNGNAVDPAIAVSYTQQGAIDYNNGLNNVASVPADYQSAYSQGWDEAKAAKIEADKKAAASSTSFNDTQDVTQNSTSTTVEQGYVEPTPTPTPTPVVEETTVFVPLEDNNSVNVIEVKTLTKQSSKMEYLQNAKSLFESFKTTSEEVAKIFLKLM